MSNREVKDILITLNSTSNPLDRYPIGNKELFEKVKQLEEQGAITYNDCYCKWTKKTKGRKK